MGWRGLRDGIGDVLVLAPPTRYLVHLYAFHRSPIHVVSYPKCGRTWLRYMLGTALCEHFGVRLADPGDVLEINRMARTDRRVPSIRFSHDDGLKEIGRLERSKRAYRSKDVVFLVRDPRDVVVSSYHQHTLRAPTFGDPGYIGSLSDFVRDPVFGIRTIVGFMNIWATQREVPRRFELVRYEDMIDDPRCELFRVLRFVGVGDPKPQAITAALERGSFERMQDLERTDAVGSERLRPSVPTDPTSFKVRRGRVGGYVDELSGPDVEYVNGALAALDPMFGY